MHDDQAHPPGTPKAPQTTQEQGDPLEAMMGAGELPAAQKPKARDLGADALEAALALQPPAAKPAAPPASAAPAAPAAAPTHTGHAPTPASHAPAATGAGPSDHHAPPPPLARGKRREWIWRGLLIVNIAALASVMALPWGGKEKAKPPVDAHEPVRPKPRRQGFALAEQGFYLRALELAGEGKFDDAIAVLEGYLRANPDLAEVEQRLVYHALAMFAVRAGRTGDASRYEAAMDRLRVGAQLPQDLLELAQQAEVEGRGADMRRYYARFLLQQRQVSPSLRAKIAEAYLKLGDGYRIEAEHGAEREAAKQNDGATPPKKSAPADEDAPGKKEGDHE